MYRDFRVKVKDIAPHNMLALRRGEAEGILTFTIAFDQAAVSSYLESRRSILQRQTCEISTAQCWQTRSSGS